MSGVAMQRSKSILPFLHFGRQIFGADDVGAGLLGFFGLRTLGEHGHAQACGPCRDGSDTTPRTIWSACLGSTPRLIDNLDRLVELGGGARLDQLHGLFDRVALVAVQAFGGFLEALGNLSWPYSLTVMPIERAEPSIISIAFSISLALRSFILASAISRTWARVTLPAVAMPGRLGAGQTAWPPS